MEDDSDERRAAWLAFRRWKRRFIASARVPPRSTDDLLYLCEAGWADCLDGWTGGCDERQVPQKVAFMQAYLSLMSLESADFAGDAQRLLSWQERARAPNIYGCWFSQSDPGMFGAGTSNIFQGTEISLFCKTVPEIDIADVSRLLPFDELTIRKPGLDWIPAEVEGIATHIKWDLAYDGCATELESWISGRFISFRLATPDYGLL